jgi:pimeloyl-ACP methyl ester carboxylesterase
MRCAEVRNSFAGRLVCWLVCCLAGCANSDDDKPSSQPRDDSGVVDGTPQTDAALGAPAADGGSDAGSDASRALPDDPSRPVGTLKWSPCAGDFECATLWVPLDYANTAGDSLRLAVTRHRATGKRLGALLVNPGGPGSSAINFVPGFLDNVSPRIAASFDLVAFDPRGVGFSTALDCHGTLQQYNAADSTPDDEAEWGAVDRVSAAFADECKQKHEKLLPHLGTLNVARDMDRVREALGEDKLSYLGFSYGVSIGAYYAELFPARVAAMVLDGAVDLRLGPLDRVLEQAKGFELGLQSYFRWCKGDPQRCSWAAVSTPEESFAALQAAVELAPIAAPGDDLGRSLGPGELHVAVKAPLYAGERGWMALSRGLAAAVAGDGSTLIEFVDIYHERQEDGSYSNIEEVFNAVSCVDAPALTVAEVRAAQDRFVAAAPTFGLSSLTSLLICAHWPVHGVQQPPPRAAGAGPIVVIGTTGDPATPYAWAQRLVEDLASATLLTYQGEGHTGFGQGDPCIDSAVEAFLVEGTPPSGACIGAKNKGVSARVVAPSRAAFSLHR